jgi:hypothetical protein
MREITLYQKDGYTEYWATEFAIDPRTNARKDGKVYQVGVSVGEVAIEVTEDTIKRLEER